MFATFRKEARDGEIVCISNTSLPPLSGSQLHHFACDRCRAKKLKCSAHRFGCDRCRDLNVTCTYSTSPQAQRQKNRRISLYRSIATAKTSDKVSSQRQEGVPKNHGEIISYKDFASKTASEHEKSGKTITITPPDSDTGFQESDPVVQEGCRVRSHVPSNTVTVTTPPSSSDLTFLDSIISDISACDSGYPILDLDTLDVTTNSYSDDTLSPSGSSGTRATVGDDGMNTGTFADETNWNVSSVAFGEQTVSVNARCLFPVETTPQTAKSRDHFRSASREKSPGLIPTEQPSDRGRNGATTKPTLNVQEPTPCGCIDLILGALEQAQNQPKVHDLSTAEQSLYFVKNTYTQCGSKIQCRNCRYDSRATTFSIMLLEKWMGILEDISRSWEDTLLSASSNWKDSSGRNEAQTHNQDVFLLDGYRIDTMQERFDIFGFLIILQIKQLAALTKVLSDKSRASQGNKHQAKLGPVILRIQELHRALSETVGILHIE